MSQSNFSLFVGATFFARTTHLRCGKWVTKPNKLRAEKFRRSTDPGWCCSLPDLNTTNGHDVFSTKRALASARFNRSCMSAWAACAAWHRLANKQLSSFFSFFYTFCVTFFQFKLQLYFALAWEKKNNTIFFFFFVIYFNILLLLFGHAHIPVWRKGRTALSLSGKWEIRLTRSIVRNWV